MVESPTTTSRSDRMVPPRLFYINSLLGGPFVVQQPRQGITSAAGSMSPTKVPHVRVADPFGRFREVPCLPALAERQATLFLFYKEDT